MKSVLSFFTFLFCLIAASAALGQTHTAYPNTPLATKAKGYYEYLPQGYNPNDSETYPLILFMHGIGEFGNGDAVALPRVLKNGIPDLIEKGKFPTSFVLKGATYRFVIITPQFVRYPEAADIDAVLNSIIAKYKKINTSRIYITGLSYGGGLTFAYAGNNNAYAQRVAAIVPIASPLPDGGYTEIHDRSRVIAANNVPVWAAHNRDDKGVDTSAVTIAYVNGINENPAPTTRARMTIYPNGGHDAWTKTYNPDRILDSANGLNVYQWMLQYQRGAPPVNAPPQANAGADQTITLPTNSISLIGSGSDSDGTITTYSWTKISGTGGTISNQNAQNITVTNLQQGSYVFRLTVTDNRGATGSDEVTIIVNGEPNKAPVAEAGADQSITLPTNSVNLNGTATDSDGTISKINWTKTEGPAAGTITNPGLAKTTVTGMAEGVYTFRLIATDNTNASDTDYVKITVNAAANKAPVADAGADMTITLPVNQAALSGNGSDDDGQIVSYLWTKTFGPSEGVIVSPTANATSVTGLVQGTYIFKLTVTDDDNATNFDEVQITVNAAAPNQSPVANAGADQSITLPTNTVTLNGSGTDDGEIRSYAWAKTAGPDAGSITNRNAAATTVTGLVQGAYTFQLTVTDDKGVTATDDVKITVNTATNKAPVADAGTDKTITLPVNRVTLEGSGTDSDGTIKAYSWTKISGPDGSVITAPAEKNTTVTNLVQGSYIFRLTVTDNDDAINNDDVTITVNPAPVNAPPQAAAGADQTITLPTSSVTLSGTGTDNDGTIASYAWTKVSGPAGGSITNPAAASTTVTVLIEGRYVFRFAVTDNDGATASDSVTITVIAAPNQAPKAVAGTDQSITLPTNTATLNGSGTDADGTINSYVWLKISGPDGGTITTPNAATTTVTALQQGRYVFRLTVTDNKGATASDSVRIEVTVVTGTGDDPAIVVFKIAATPNPTANYFSLKITSPSIKPVYLQLTDAFGRVVEEWTNVQPNELVLIGHNYKPGVYYAQVVQNGKRTTVKLLKL